MILAILPWLLSARNIFGSVIGFFKTPLGQILGALLIVGAVFLYGHHRGEVTVKAQWAAANAAAQAKKQKFEAEVQTRLDQVEREKSDALEKQQKEFQKKLDEYEEHLKKHPSDRRTIGDDLSKRMLGIGR